MTEAELDAVADELNERPRKRLAFANPTERLSELLLQYPPESAVPPAARADGGAQPRRGPFRVPLVDRLVGAVASVDRIAERRREPARG